MGAGLQGCARLPARVLAKRKAASGRHAKTRLEMARRDLGNLRKELHNALLLGDTQRFARKDCIFYRKVRACRAVLVSRIRFSIAQAISLALTKDFSRAEVVQHVDKSKDYNVSPATYCGTKQR